jgi:hypothetical protein
MPGESGGICAGPGTPLVTVITTSLSAIPPTSQVVAVGQATASTLTAAVRTGAPGTPAVIGTT